MANEPKEPCRIITEGFADSAFFNALIKNRKIANCDADCTHVDGNPKGCAGKSGITATLRALAAFAELRPNDIRGVILAVDIDDDPDKTLKETIKSIRAVIPSVSCPKSYLDIVKEFGFAVSIMGIPWHDQLGSLDTLLFEAMQTTHADIIGPLGTFCEATKRRHEGWSSNKKSKMKLRCTLASSYQDDPGLALSHMLSRADHPFDLQDQAFNQIARHIEHFTERVLKGK
jgi:uncharacterized protein DUF3226